MGESSKLFSIFILDITQNPTIVCKRKFLSGEILCFQFYIFVKQSKPMETDIREILKKYWGYEQFRSLQEEIIRSVVSGKDTLALMPTGGGKSITYQIAALKMGGVCIVITPLIALIKDQVEDLRKREIPAEAVYTGMQPDAIESAINKCIAGKSSFLYISPERLASEHFRLRLKQMNVSLLTVDESHCISQWGYDFRPSYLRIAEVRSFFPKAPVLALTATATPEVAEDIQNQLKFSAHHILSKSFRRENISYVIRSVNDKLGELLHILSQLKSCAIVYVRRRAAAEELAGFLEKKGVHAGFYHAGLSTLQRAKVQEDWKDDTVPVIVATNAFGMGIDKPDVRVVVHFDIPDSLEAYFQEAGRAGRDGKKAYAVLLCNNAALTAMKTRVAKGFPEKDYIRQVYQALGNCFQLEEGDGAGYAFEFDPDNFVKNFKLDYAKTLSAIKILQLAGYLESTTDVHARSRICFLVVRDRLYDIRLNDPLADRLLEVIMRTYSGIFVQYAYINEQLLADQLEVKREDIYHTLVALAKRKIVSYVPGNDRPYIVYHQPQLPASYLMIGKEAYEDRKLAYAGKVDQIKAYIEEAKECRQLFLMRYFGQNETIPCGICDCCLQNKKEQGTISKRDIDKEILELISKNDMNIKDFAYHFEEDRELALQRLRFLLDNHRVWYKTPTILSLKN